MKSSLLLLCSVIFLFTACRNDMPLKPEELGAFYWGRLQQKNFAEVKSYLVDLGELNQLIELFPAIQKYIDKGSYSTEYMIVVGEEDVFNKILEIAKEKNLDFKQATDANFRFREWGNKQGKTVGDVKVTVQLETHEIELSIAVFDNGSQWKYLGIRYYRFARTKSPEEENPVMT